jgi:hypothetical protein
MSENFENYNSYERFVDRVLDCVNTVLETPSQIYDRYRLKNQSEKTFDNRVLVDIQNVLDNLHAENEILRIEDSKLGFRYCALDSGAKNIVPFVRKSSLL